MKEFNELYNKNGIRLVMTTLNAGGMGLSYERGNINRKKILEKLGLKSEDIFFVSQKHSRTVVLTDEWCADPLSEADGIISHSSDEAIAVTIADCMPIFLHDNSAGIRAILHSGWKGTGIALEALALMQKKYGCRPSDITAVLGPSIGSCCYNVDEQRASVFRDEWGSEVVEKRQDTFYLSLRRANELMLKNAGIAEIISIDDCTSCSNTLGSFRRQGPDDFTQMFCLSYLNDDK